MGILRLLFGLTVRVNRLRYIIAGFALMAVKVGVDNALMFIATGKPWPMLAYWTPSIIMKNEALGAQPTWTLTAMILVTLPFMWVGMSMSVRRAADAGMSPWLGALFLVPGFNYISMLVLAAWPSARPETLRWQPMTAPGVYRGGELPSPPSMPPPDIGDAVRGALLGILAAGAFGGGMLALSIYALNMYGAALFFGTPFLMGAVSAFLYNHKALRSLGYTVLVGQAAVVMTGLGILLFAVEGVLCLAMAAPIACVLAAAGSVLGFFIVKYTHTSGRVFAIVLLVGPGSVGIESATAHPTLREVSTSIEIDAPPDIVWKHTIGFSELPPPPQWFFQLGVAYPMRARIDGEGVGAIRRCEFSTGPFIEPITVWEPGKKLGFDVLSQPPSMTELSPYRHVNAPHLEGYMVSRRGEFRLALLPNNRTRLEGSTFYTLSIFPETYWVVWGELLLHSIHTRVLEHIKSLSEAEMRSGG